MADKTGGEREAVAAVPSYVAAAHHEVSISRFPPREISTFA